MMVMDEGLDPSATTGVVPVMEEFAATAEVDTKLTVVESVESAAGELIEIVFVSATVEVMDPTA